MKTNSRPPPRPWTTSPLRPMAAAIVLAVLAGCQGTSPPDAGPAGMYACETVTRAAQSAACDDPSPSLTLTDDGTWIWYANTGRFTLAGAQVVFASSAPITTGPPTWGPAEVPSDGLVFHVDGATHTWRRAGPDSGAVARLAGAFLCETTDLGGATRPCEDRTSPLVLDATGAWTFGDNTGGWSVMGAYVSFQADSAHGGPSTWGPAEAGDGTLVFRGEQRDHSTVFVRA